MEKIYEELGFKNPDFIENSYGIKIYLGTKGQDDWSIEIPKELAQYRCARYKSNQNCIIYLISEEDALRIAEVYTKLAKQKILMEVLNALRK